MKVFILLVVLVFVLGCTTPGQRLEDTIEMQGIEIDKLEKEINSLEEELDIFERAEDKRQTRDLLNSQKNKNLLDDTKELLLVMWQTSTFCGEYLLCDSDCDFGEYTKSDYLNFCNAYYYSFNGEDYDNLEFRLEGALG